MGSGVAAPFAVPLHLPTAQPSVAPLAVRTPPSLRHPEAARGHRRKAPPLASTSGPKPTPLNAPAVRLPVRPLGPRAALDLSRTADHPPLVVGAPIPRPLSATRVGLAADDRTVIVAPAWLKPTKFAVSIAIYSFTFVWLLGFVRGHSRLVGLDVRDSAAMRLREQILSVLQTCAAPWATWTSATRSTSGSGARWRRDRDRLSAQSAGRHPPGPAPPPRSRLRLGDPPWGARLLRRHGGRLPPSRRDAGTGRGNRGGRRARQRRPRRRRGRPADRRR